MCVDLFSVFFLFILFLLDYFVSCLSLCSVRCTLNSVVGAGLGPIAFVLNGGFLKWEYTEIIHLNKVFFYKTIYFGGTPMTMETYYHPLLTIINHH